MNIGTLIEGRASSDIISVEVGQTVRDAVRILAEKRIGALPVLEQGRVAGIFSERDVIVNGGRASLLVQQRHCDRDDADSQQEKEPHETAKTRPGVSGLFGIVERRVSGHGPSHGDCGTALQQA